MREIRPSNSATWMFCHGAPALVDHLGIADTTSYHAAEGTVAHLMAAKILENQVDPQRFLGKVREQDGFEVEIEQDMIDHVMTYVEAVRTEIYAADDWAIEETIDCSKILGHKRTGTADARTLRNRKMLSLHDLKFGQGVEVFAEKNTQLLIYGASYATTVPFSGLPDKVRFVIHQPRIKGSPDEWTITKDQLKSFAYKARRIAKIASTCEPGEYLNAGEKQCQWCPAKPHCPAFQEMVAGVFDDISEDGHVIMPATNEDLGERLAWVPMVEMWLKAVKQAGYQALDTGREVPGFKLVHGRKGNRQWANERKALKMFERFRLRKDEIYDMKVKSPAQIEKLISDQRWEKLEEYGLITQEEGNLIVVPEDDPREGVVKGDVFDDLTGE